MTSRPSRSGQPGLADPSNLSAVDAGDKALTVVVIETPKGSRNKYAYDPVDRVFDLKTVSPAGMTFPYDFGFVPSTRGGDLEEFFVNYHRLSEQQFRILAMKGPDAARRCIKQARKRAR